MVRLVVEIVERAYCHIAVFVDVNSPGEYIVLHRDVGVSCNEYLGDSKGVELVVFDEHIA